MTLDEICDDVFDSEGLSVKFWQQNFQKGHRNQSDKHNGLELGALFGYSSKWE